MKDTWSSRFGFIMAATGAAVGLGSLWMFPYFTGKNGGSAFVLVYLCCIALVGIPALVGEILIGKIAKQNQVDSLKALAKKYKASPYWPGIGIMGTVALYMVLSFYSVVAGWSIAYAGFVLDGKFIDATPESVTMIWGSFLSSPYELLLYHSIFMFLTMIIVYKGVKQGIELASKIMMPFLFLILIALLIYGMNTTGFKDALGFLFTFNFEKITAEVVLEAIGQAFFTLALGAGCMLAYGCYLPKDVKIGRSVWIIATLNALVSLLAGIAIFSLVFSNGLEANASGPGLMFQTLPLAFSKMSFGYLIGLAFFILLLFAALTSSISLAEPLVVILSEKTKVSRKTAAWIVGFAAWASGILVLLSFNVLSEFKLFNKYTFFDVFIETPSNILLPLGVLGFSIFAGWVIPSKVAKENLNFTSSYGFTLWNFLVRYLSPVAICIIITASIVF